MDIMSLNPTDSASFAEGFDQINRHLGENGACCVNDDVD
jgi:hypothetical protein